MATNDPESPQSPPQIQGNQGNLSITMGSNAQIPRSALSPVGSEWSGISKYNSADIDLMSASTSATATAAVSASAGPPARPPANVSPPSSIARSSDGTGLYATSEGLSVLKNIALEEQVAVHHAALSKWLRDFLETKGNLRPNRARDKLLRLSITQFQELSTDVYDELQRREPGMAASSLSPDTETPPFLLPKPNYHPKRNQARQKLSTLPADRFRDLATDVFYELERRFPRFTSGLLPSFASPTNSIDGRGVPLPIRGDSPGIPRMASPGPMGSGRMGSPGPGMAMGRGPSYGPGQQQPPPPGPPGPNGYRRPPQGPPPRGAPGPPRGPLGGGPPEAPNSFGRPLPKTYQSGTIIPNKSTMVEDDDDGDDDDDLDAFSLEEKQANGQRVSQSNEADKKLIADYQSKVETLQGKVAGLEASLEESEEKLRLFQSNELRKEDELTDKRNEWEDLRTVLEGKIADAEGLNRNLQAEIDRLKAEAASNDQQMGEQQQEIEQLRSSRDSRDSGDGGGGSGESGGSGGSSGGDSQQLQQLQQQHQQLLRQHDDLKQELKEQEEVTEEVRREAMEFLNQMKLISEQADNSLEREEKLNSQIQKLQGDVQEWKSRYAKAKTTIRSIRSSSLGLQVPTSGGLFGPSLVDGRGLVRAVHLTKFQISIDELLKVARSINFAQSLEQVKSVIIATRALTQDIDGEQQGEGVAKLVARVSATANNLTTAAKNHAAGCGLSPVSLLDAAASHLTASVVELVKLVKIRPTQEGETDDEEEDYHNNNNIHSAVTAFEEDAADSSPDSDDRHVSAPFHQQVHYTNGNGNGRAVPEVSVSNAATGRLSDDSLYSPVGSPREPGFGAQRSRKGEAKGSVDWGRASGRAPLFGVRAGANDVEELRIFLENQTNGIVESIQSLLVAIKSDSTAKVLAGHIKAISLIVTAVLTSTESAMSGDYALRERGEWIVRNLGKSRERMQAMVVEWEELDDGRDGPGAADGRKVDKENKSKLAGLAFDTARETKELVRTVEDINNGQRRQMAAGAVDLS